MDYLRAFNGDHTTKEQLIEFIHEYINTVALERMYKKDDVSHIADATALINEAFEHLEEIYGIKTKPNAIINEAK